MRFVFTPPADHAAGLLTLPWSEPLADWRDERLVEIRQRGISRHVVRFVYDDDTLYALKELSERLARREYRLLRALAELGIPAVEVVGVAVDRDGPGQRRPGRDPGHQVPQLRGHLPGGLLQPPGPAADRRAARRAGRAAGPAAPVRVLLGRLLAVQHAVPARRGHAGGVPGRRGDQRAASGADRRAAAVGRRARHRAVLRRAARPAGGRAAPGRRGAAGDRRGARAPVRVAVAGADPRGDPASPRSSATGSPSACAGSTSSASTRTRSSWSAPATATSCG